MHKIPKDPIYDLRDSDFGPDDRIKCLDDIPREELKIDDVDQVSYREIAQRERGYSDIDNQERIPTREDRKDQQRPSAPSQPSRPSRPSKPQRNEDINSTDEERDEMRIGGSSKKVKFNVDR